MKMLRSLHIPLLVLITALAITACQPQSIDQTTPKAPKNIILLIGDGMGYAQLQATMLHSETPLHMLGMPVTGFQNTSALNDEITDSGAAGTALATGFKTNNGFIGMLPDGTPLVNMTERMAAAGKRTAIVVSCDITHATPAAFLAHNESRRNMEAIAGDIALRAPVDIFMGGGLNNFNKRKDGINHIQTLVDRGFAIDSVFDATAWDCHPKHAVFLAAGHPSSVLEGRGNQLVYAVEHAINCLASFDEGFFLMVEGSQIDWAGHGNDSAYLISEMIDFDQAVGKALEFARANGETLVIATSDHETGGLTLVRPEVRDGKAYIHFSTDDHTAVMVPVFAFGPGAENFTGLYENTAIFKRIVAFLN